MDRCPKESIIRPNKIKNTGSAAPWMQAPTLPKNIKTQSILSAAANRPSNETLFFLLALDVSSIFTTGLELEERFTSSMEKCRPKVAETVKSDNTNWK